MKFTKYLILCILIISFSACEEEDEDSVSSEETPMTCELILKKLEVQSFADIDLGQYSATCSDAVLTISPDANDSTRTFVCNETNVTAGSLTGNITVDMSGLSVRSESLSGRMILSAVELGASFSPEGSADSPVEAECTFGFSGEIYSDDPPQLYDIPSNCSVDGTPVNYNTLPDDIDNCATSGGEATDPGMKDEYDEFKSFYQNSENTFNQVEINITAALNINEAQLFEFGSFVKKIETSSLKKIKDL